MLKIDDISGFTMQVVREVASGIEQYNRESPTMLAGYPPYVEIQVSVYDKDGDYHQLWFKVPVQGEE